MVGLGFCLRFCVNFWLGTVVWFGLYLVGVGLVEVGAVGVGLVLGGGVVFARWGMRKEEITSQTNPRGRDFFFFCILSSF